VLTSLKPGHLLVTRPWFSQISTVVYKLSVAIVHHIASTVEVIAIYSLQSQQIRRSPTLTEFLLRKAAQLMRIGLYASIYHTCVVGRIEFAPVQG